MKKIFFAALLTALCLYAPLTSLAQKTVGGGDLVFTPRNAEPILFSHERHVINQGLSCDGCHQNIFHKKKGSNKMSMALITKGGFCGMCHNGTKAFNANDPVNCKRCHGNQFRKF